MFASSQVCKYANLQVYKYVCLQILKNYKLQINNYNFIISQIVSACLQVHKFAILQVCK